MNDLSHLEDGFGETSAADLAELRKALEIGYQQPTTGVGFDALRVESLEATLKLLTYQAIHVRLWNMIPKTNAFSTIEEFNRLIEYGTDGGGFVPSGELPEEEDTTYERADEKVKYIGSTRSVHHPATLVRTVPADLIAQETSNGALWIMGKTNRGLYYASEANIAEEYNGLPEQIESGAGHVVDLEGAVLSADAIENASQLINDNFGFPTRLFSNPKVFTDFGKAYQSFQRWQQPGGQAGVAGTPTTGYNTLSGLINFEPDTFVKRGSAPLAAASSPKAPVPPTVTEVVNAGTTSKFRAGDVGDYIYQVSAINRFGESAPSASSPTSAVTAGDDVDVTITDGGGAFAATAYKIYRTAPDGTVFFYINKTVARATVGGVPQPTTVYNDDNEWRHNTFIGLLLDVTNQSLTFRQLAPMMRMPLATISPAIRWMQLLYGTPIVFAPKKNVLFKNIGGLDTN